jgi:hypothetical protein
MIISLYRIFTSVCKLRKSPCRIPNVTNIGIRCNTSNTANTALERGDSPLSLLVHHNVVNGICTIALQRVEQYVQNLHNSIEGLFGFLLVQEEHAFPLGFCLPAGRRRYKLSTYVVHLSSFLKAPYDVCLLAEAKRII